MTEAVLPERIKTYLDSLTDEQRDRVISAKAFKIGGGYQPGKPASQGGTRELTRIKRKQQAMGHDFTPGAMLKVEKETYTVVEPPSPEEPAVGCLIDHATAGTSTDQYGTVGSEFDSFYRTHGDAAIRAIKMYAARLNAIELPLEQQVEEWEPVAA